MRIIPYSDPHDPTDPLVVRPPRPLAPIAGPVCRYPADKVRLYRAALALTGQKAVAFAGDLSVTDQHVLLVLKGKRRSPRVEQAVDALIREAFGDVFGWAT